MAVLDSVMFAGFLGVVDCMQSVPVSNVGMVSRLLVVTCLVVPGCLPMMFRRMFVMLCCCVVVFNSLVVFGHLLLLGVVGMERAL